MANPSKLASKHQAILRQQIIDEDRPGTILKDFASLLDFIGGEEIVVSGKHDLLPMKRLPELNAKFSHPIEIDLKRPQQKSYPNINGLYLLLRASGLGIVETIDDKRILALDDAVLNSWRPLNPTERYFTLFETWLLRGDAQTLGEHRGLFFESPMRPWQRFFEKIPTTGLAIAGDKDKQMSLSYSPGLHNLALLDLFGLITLEQIKPETGKGWNIKRVQRTPLGDALLALLALYFLDHFERLLALGEISDHPLGSLQPLIQPFFLEWRQNLVLPETGFQNGLYTFKVSLGKKVWRRIVAPAKANLDQLSSSILDAFEFDYDHLYQFTYKNRYGVSAHVNHPYMDEAPFADKVQVGDLGLKAGETMTYLYDFGDQWQFGVLLERIEPADPKIGAPKVVEFHGVAPEQYPSWDE
jgi:hypothetical protein